jgi:hypothetical protein
MKPNSFVEFSSAAGVINPQAELIRQDNDLKPVYRGLITHGEIICIQRVQCSFINCILSCSHLDFVSSLLQAPTRSIGTRRALVCAVYMTGRPSPSWESTTCSWSLRCSPSHSQCADSTKKSLRSRCVRRGLGGRGGREGRGGQRELTFTSRPVSCHNTARVRHEGLVYWWANGLFQKDLELDRPVYHSRHLILLCCRLLLVRADGRGRMGASPPRPASALTSTLLSPPYSMYMVQGRVQTYLLDTDFQVTPNTCR